MNTIAAEMPVLNAVGGNTGKSKVPEDEKQIRFDEVLKGEKEHAAKDDKKKEPDAEDGSAAVIGAEALGAETAVLNVPGTVGNMGKICPVFQVPEGKVQSIAPAEIQAALPVDVPAEAAGEAVAEGKMKSASGPVVLTGGEVNAKNPKEPVVKSGQTEIPDGSTKDSGLLNSRGAEQTAAPAWMNRQTEGTDVPRTNEKPDNAEVNTAAVRSSVPGEKTVDYTPVSGDAAAAPKPAHAEGIRKEYMDMLKNDIVRQAASGKQQFEIQLHPGNLGTLVIKASYEAGKAVISIVCSEAKTMQAMSQQAGELAGIMEARTGNATEVVVESRADDYLQQQQERNGREQGREPDRQQQENQKRAFQESVDFLQQLRLGLA